MGGGPRRRGAGYPRQLHGRRERGRERLVRGRVDAAGALRERVGARPLALLGHERAERLLVDLDALLGGHLEREVDREAGGVVPRERLVAAAQRRRARAGRGRRPRLARRPSRVR